MMVGRSAQNHAPTPLFGLTRANLILPIFAHKSRVLIDLRTIGNLRRTYVVFRFWTGTP